MRGEKTAKIDRLAFSGEDPPLLFVHISLSFADPFSLSNNRSIVKIVVPVIYL